MSYVQTSYAILAAKPQLGMHNSIVSSSLQDLSLQKVGLTASSVRAMYCWASWHSPYLTAADRPMAPLQHPASKSQRNLSGGYITASNSASGSQHHLSVRLTELV
jgi:hypothetical protein